MRQAVESLSGENKERLRQKIRSLGFDEARFTDLSALGAHQLEYWVESGFHADMEWLRKSVEKRLNPNLVLEGVCSVIMLGINYFPEKGEARDQTRWGKYSLYEDYHDTVLAGLKKVGGILEEDFGIESNDYRYYVDTGPVVERGWAAASGMGWQGKNGMLISKKHGNWLLLATLLTRIPIEPDRPTKKTLKPGDSSLGVYCGKCRSCMEKCPTNAIIEPGLLDANLCISYQTIENKGIVPRELRPSLGSRIFGCDICLDICPWNRFAEKGSQMLLAKRYDIIELTLLEILEMNIETFRRLFRKTPIKRLKLRGLLRNACIMAGNIGENSDWAEGASQDWLSNVTESLVKLATHEEFVVRVHAVWAVYRIAFGNASNLLAQARLAETEECVLDEYRWWENRVYENA